MILENNNTLKKIFIFLKKIKFKNNREKVKILLYHKFNSELISKKLKEKVLIFDPSNEILLPILLKSIFSNFFKNITYNYSKTFIKQANPELILTFIDNDLNFYLLKKHFKKINFFAVQNGIRAAVKIKKNKKNVPFEGMFEFKKKLECDNIFCLNYNTINRYSKFINSHFFNLGSFKSNFVKIRKKSNKKILSFISQYSPPKRKDEIFMNLYGSRVKREDFFLAEKKVIKFLSNFCLKKKLILQIIPRTNSQNEYEFYEDILKTKINFLYKFKKNSLSAYELIDKSTIIAGVDSTLLYESLSRKKKVIFFPIRKAIMNKKYKEFDFQEFNFSWPLNFGNVGSFWTNDDSELYFEKISNFVYKISSKSWIKMINGKKYKKIIIPYDYGNKVFFNKLKY